MSKMPTITVEIPAAHAKDTRTTHERTCCREPALDLSLGRGESWRSATVKCGNCGATYATVEVPHDE